MISPEKSSKNQHWTDFAVIRQPKFDAADALTYHRLSPLATLLKDLC